MSLQDPSFGKGMLCTAASSSGSRAPPPLAWRADAACCAAPLLQCALVYDSWAAGSAPTRPEGSTGK
jgi:hypothetical protein